MSILKTIYLQHLNASNTNMTLTQDGSSSVYGYYRFGSNPVNPSDSTASIYDQASIGPTISGYQFTVRTGSSPVENMRVDQAGRVTKPYQPFFSAYKTSGASNTAGQTIIWNTAINNIGNHYNTSTGRFTAPVAGVYLFRADFRTNSSTTAVYMDIATSTGLVTRHEEPAGAVNQYHQTVAAIYYMSASDYAYCYVGGAGAISPDAGIVDRFEGYLLG